MIFIVGIGLVIAAVQGRDVTQVVVLVVGALLGFYFREA
jgi:hypothetical protein